MPGSYDPANPPVNPATIALYLTSTGWLPDNEFPYPNANPNPRHFVKDSHAVCFDDTFTTAALVSEVVHKIAAQENREFWPVYWDIAAYADRAASGGGGDEKSEGDGR